MDIDVVYNKNVWVRQDGDPNDFQSDDVMNIGNRLV